MKTFFTFKHLFSCLEKVLFIILLIIAPFVMNVGTAEGQDIKRPVVAGMFYPGESGILEKKVDRYLKEAYGKGPPLASHIFGLMAPHAGYDYSGGVAGYAYSQIKGKDYKTVIIIGTSHQVPFRGISIWPSGAWETPLGNIPVDGKIARQLMDSCKSIKVYPAAFAREHSLEVQLPFLQRSLKSFKIVPLCTGSLTLEDHKSLSYALMDLLEKNPKDILIVASSDMSHYHPYSKADKMDRAALKDVEELNVDKLTADLEKGACEFCGAPGVIVLMMMASSINGSAKTLHYANSGDVSGDKSRVVGYGATAFLYGDGGRELNKAQQEILLGIARKTLDGHISRGDIPKIDVDDGKLMEKKGAFVTLTKKGALRGCIGYIVPHSPLAKAVSEMTVAASTGDPRFPPVSRRELKDIRIEISVLSPLKQIENIDEIVVGRHGLYIKEGNYSGLLLPQVAVEHKWDRNKFLDETCLKAGLPRNSWKDKGTAIFTFSAQIFSER